MFDLKEDILVISYNKEWIYRNMHGYHILINMCDNNILSISSDLAELFSLLEIDKNVFNEVLQQWKIQKNFPSEKNLTPILNYFMDKGVLTNE